MRKAIAFIGVLGTLIGFLALGATLAKWSFEYHGVQRWEQHSSCLTIDPEARPPEKIWVNL